ncbi:MAG: TonB-dependent receptor [Alphaproteobacteria bacterium]|nr:TonB-dependent receptor [Alphaproteobacteria bacterium]
MVIRSKAASLIALLLPSAAVPALAQNSGGIETVNVTAEHRLEDLATVPMAVSAFQAGDIESRRLQGVRDIQFATPNVNYTKNNFTSSNFSIRGIGTQVISSDSEYGVAFNLDDVYYAVPPIDAAQFYDVERIEVLRGPQSTLYGRGATGGAFNLFSARPKLDVFSASGSFTYGNYNAVELEGMLNVPLIDGHLGLRLAGDWVRHDGFTQNIYGAGPSRVDSRDLWSGRALLRWQPQEDTTIDLIASHSAEADSRLRGQKQLCDTDPTGTLGCLPDALSGNGGAVNLNATFFNTPVSKQSFGTLFASVYQALGQSPASARASAASLGITDLTQPFVAAPGAVPDNPRVINSDVAPHLRARSNAVTFEAHQRLNDWLSATLVAAYADSTFFSNQSYTNQPGPAFNSTLLATSETTFQTTLNSFAGAGLVPPSYASATAGPYAFVLDPSHAGTLPTSNFTNLGIISHSIARYSGHGYVYDQADGFNHQNSVELRFSSDLDGPLNFQIGLYYLRADSPADYELAANTQDYGMVLLGGVLGPLRAASLCANATGCIYGPPFYHNEGKRVAIDSKAIYGEVYYDAVPDTLKLTFGLRGTEDRKSFSGRIAILNGLIPAGTSNEEAALTALVAQGQTDFDASTSGAQLFEEARRKFDKLTGRAVVSYTPHLDFTDQTLIYASYSRGYKAGGSNPGIQNGNLMGIPATYAPESVDAYELGSKNRLLDGTLEANLTAWYYDYRNYQISTIVANTSVNSNINATLDGLEAELRWKPASRWSFNLNADMTESHVGNTMQVDTRNPTAGNVNTLLLKDSNLTTTNAGNCVLYYGGSNFAADFANLQALSGGLFFAPPGGTDALKVSGIAHAAYGTCYAGTSPGDSFYALSLNSPALQALLAATHFATSNPAIGGTLTGVPRNLKGNMLGNTAPGSISFGAAYSQPLEGGFTLTGRIEWYWRASMYGRIFNDGADRLAAFHVANLFLSLTPPTGRWALEAFAKNLGDSAGINGIYLAGATSGLYSGAFYTDPRTYGLSLRASL